MTVAIAASCTIDNEPAVVLCFDRKVSTEKWSSETEFKIEGLAGGFVAIFAGNISQARELIATYRDHFRSNLIDMMHKEGIQDDLRAPLGKRKRMMVEALVQRRLGLTYEEFLDRGEQIDASLRASIFNAIDELSIEVELIIVGFRYKTEDEQGKPIHPFPLFRIAWGDVETHRNFTCIGAGTSAAEHMLHRREQSINRSPIETIYNVYEAKKFSELAPSVGQQTILVICNPAGLLRGITTEGLAWLDRHYQENSPRPVSIQLPEGGLRRIFE